MPQTTCKYELWRASVNDEQKRRDILFCSCGSCATARKAWHMRAVDFRPAVAERLKLLNTKTAPVPSTAEERDVN